MTRPDTAPEPVYIAPALWHDGQVDEHGRLLYRLTWAHWHPAGTGACAAN